jgi:hypothetical protein
MKFVSRRIGDDLKRGPNSVVLRPLDGTGPPTAFTWSAALPDGPGDHFESRFAVHGRWRAPPGFAVSADWLVAKGGDRAGFEESRLALFNLRIDAIGAFCVDYLLRRVDDPMRFTVLGLYGDRAGLDLARSHREIQSWATSNPASKWGVRDEGGMKLFTVVEGSSGPG